MPLTASWPLPAVTPRCVAVTGGAGFIGSNFLLGAVKSFPEIQFVNLDSLTYAGNLANLKEIEGCENYRFERTDIVDRDAVGKVFAAFSPDWVVHFAAESHVDRSILGPAAFIQTNVVGTGNLLDACRAHWEGWEGKLFHHVSTDEVYGSLGETGLFTETTAYDPSSPYSASKASSDHLVRAYGHTYGMPVRITNCSNNYGPFQFPEKLIPLTISNAKAGKPLPVYGQGQQVRDWLHVEDHCEAIWTVLAKGVNGETYNIGGNSERRNLDVVKTICTKVAEQLERSESELFELIQFVTDRPGHDYRYAIDASKISRELGWSPKRSFDSGIEDTVKWYLSNTQWVSDIQTGAYREWLEANYAGRESLARLP